MLPAVASFLAAADVPAAAFVRIGRLSDPSEFSADRIETRTPCWHEQNRRLNRLGKIRQSSQNGVWTRQEERNRPCRQRILRRGTPRSRQDESSGAIDLSARVSLSAIVQRC